MGVAGTEVDKEAVTEEIIGMSCIGGEFEIFKHTCVY
jgi:hypothetical protein